MEMFHIPVYIIVLNPFTIIINYNQLNNRPALLCLCVLIVWSFNSPKYAFQIPSQIETTLNTDGYLWKYLPPYSKKQYSADGKILK